MAAVTDTIHIVCCSNYKAEIEELQQREKEYSFKAHFFPPRCNRPFQEENSFWDVFENSRRHCSRAPQLFWAAHAWVVLRLQKVPVSAGSLLSTVSTLLLKRTAFSRTSERAIMLSAPAGLQNGGEPFPAGDLTGRMRAYFFTIR